MKTTFTTAHIQLIGGRVHAGDHIVAESREEAEAIAARRGLCVTGEFKQKATEALTLARQLPEGLGRCPQCDCYCYTCPSCGHKFPYSDSSA